MEKNTKYIEDGIILCNNPEDDVVAQIFDDDEEHCYKGKFYDGIAVLHKDSDENEGVPEKLVMTYPTMEVVKGNADLAHEIRDYAGLDAEDDINYFDIALKYGAAHKPEEIELPF